MIADEGYPSTPELDKMLAVKEKSQPIGEFLEWLACEWHIHLPASIEELLAEYFEAEYFEIDLTKMEKERQALLDFVRSQQDG